MARSRTPRPGTKCQVNNQQLLEVAVDGKTLCRIDAVMHDDDADDQSRYTLRRMHTFSHRYARIRIQNAEFRIQNSEIPRDDAAGRGGVLAADFGAG